MWRHCAARGEVVDHCEGENGKVRIENEMVGILGASASEEII